MRGHRKRKPDHLKVVQGTDRPDRMNPDAPTAAEGSPIAPDWLSERATEIFGDLVSILDDMGIASPDNAASLAMLASRLEEVEITTAIIEDLGRTYTTINAQGGVMHRGRPEVAQRSEAMRHAQSLLAEFGLTPASLSKVSVGGKRDANPFSKL